MVKINSFYNVGQSYKIVFTEIDKAILRINKDLFLDIN